MKDIHKTCMLLVKEKMFDFIKCIPSHIKQKYFYVNVDEIVIDFNPDIDYIETKKIIDPNNDFRMNIFELNYCTDTNCSW